MDRRYRLFLLQSRQHSLGRRNAQRLRPGNDSGRQAGIRTHLTYLMDKLVADVEELYRSSFACAAQCCARAPGRVEVLGNHTDYNEGLVLSAAIDRHLCVAVGRSDNTFEFVSGSFPERVVISEVVPQKEYAWTNYALGVYHWLKAAGYPVAPFRMAVTSTIPQGAGLSSSAAFEVASGLALGDLYGFKIDKQELAHLCRKAEHTFAGANCGLLDQYSVLFGKQQHLLLIDFRTLDYRPISLAGLDIVFAITESGVTHRLGESAYNDRRIECESAARYFSEKDPAVHSLRDVNPGKLHQAGDELQASALKRAQHVIGEIERVKAAIELLEQKDLRGFGKLLYGSHESSLVNFENSCPELDSLVRIASQFEGAYGSRLTGGGFGGATLSVLDCTIEKHTFVRHLTDAYARETGHTCAIHFATPAGGAEIIER
ncbi:MAG: galactokinase [Chitinivibrionales bacterium]|nr:galactokinase [Chitinivibrionales bacterium]